MYNFDHTLLPWMGKINKEFTFLVQTSFEQNNIDLTRHQWLVLKKLDENDGQIQNNLAFITDRDKTSLTRLINTMERKDLVTRRADTNDKRVNKIFITDKGSNILSSSLPIMKELINVMQRGLSNEELTNTIATLKAVRENLENSLLKRENQLT